MQSGQTVIALTGPYNPAMKHALYEALPPGFSVVEVASEHEYAKLRDADYVILRTLRYGAETFADSPRLKMLAKYGVGFDTIDVAAASARNIPVVICTGINSQSVAEMTVLQMLAACRNLLPLSTGLKNGMWIKDKYTDVSHTLGGKTIGLVGLGSIGGRVAHIVRAFGASVIYYSRTRLPKVRERELGLLYAPLDELLATADIVSLHVPGSAETRNLLCRERIGAMKPGAILVNNSRGFVVDQDALVEALQAGTIRAAALDVFAEEPPTGSPLLHMENVVPTPHIAGATAGLDLAMVRQCLEHIVCFHTKQPVPRRNVVNFGQLPDPSVIRCEELP